MKKYLIALFLFSTVLGLQAENNIPHELTPTNGNYINYNVSGKYVGNSIPIKMNGKPIIIGSILPCKSDFSIDQNGILSGSMVVPGVGHSFNLSTLDSVSGIGTYDIDGTFTKNSGQDKTIEGTIQVTKLTNESLEFKCVAILDGDPNSESIFTFSGTRQ